MHWHSLWIILSVAVINDNDEKSMTSLIDEKDLKDYDNAVIVSSLEGLYNPVIIGFKNSKAIDVAPVYDKDNYPIFSNTDQEILSY